MSKKNDKVNASRRNFLMGAVRRIRKEDAQSCGPIAASSGTISLIREANDAYAAEDWDEAIRLYREYLKKEKDLDVRLRLGETMYKAGRYIPARTEFRTVLRGRPKELRAMILLGLTYARAEDLEKAAEAWREYFDPHNIPMQRELNLQIGLIDDGMAESPESVARAVEAQLDCL
jgi:Flp pilus assembly protein TadD